MKKENKHTYWERSVSVSKWLSIITLLLVLFVTSGVIFGHLTFTHEVNKNIDNYSSHNQNLISELGVVREENLILKSRLEHLEKYVMKIANAVPTEDDDGNDEFTHMLEYGSDMDALPDDIIFPDNLLNVLIMGTHDQLTDTIILASINPNTEKIIFVSIPRDLSVSGRKINGLYKQYGATNIMSELEEVTGLTITHYLAINMDAFEDVIDILGGVTIENEKDIVDYYYPTSQKGYTLYKLSAGTHELDGENALKYARSRKSTSDFDRALRQQQIISAVKSKLDELGISDINQIRQIYNTLIENIDTDVGFFTALSYYNEYRTYEFSTGHVIDTEEYLYGTRNFVGQSILLPYDTSYQEIQSYIYTLVTD